MCARLCAWGSAVGVLVVVWGVCPERGWGQGEHVGAFERGQKLFERVWQPTHGADAASDGLGPLFNERSCVACHSLGGIGGAGPNAKNVELLTALIPSGRSQSSTLPERLLKVHRGFAGGTSIVLHRFGTDPRYADFRLELLGLKPRSAQQIINVNTAQTIARQQGDAPVKTIKADGAKLLLSQRNTTPLFGAGLIESISTDQIKTYATLQTREHPNVTGRFVGRFGWRGQMNDLGDFIRGACAVELGLQVRTHAQAIDPLPGAGEPMSRKTVDLSDADCDDLTAFVADLPAPRRIAPADDEQAEHVHSGELLFHTVGCGVCHPPMLGSAVGIYSDLLLHDMGPRLIDPLPARLIANESSSQFRISSGGYNGGGVSPGLSGELVLEARREWKTPPLWGVRDSGPYLHDGRAKTIAEAIALHGGEAAESAHRYQFLSRESRARLLAFLSTLAAPEPSKLPKLAGPATSQPLDALTAAPRNSPPK
jgi:CxxC motif-containing protein (DUF1111 family)